MSQGGAAVASVEPDRRGLLGLPRWHGLWIPVGLLLVAAFGWAWSVHSASDMTFPGSGMADGSDAMTGGGDAMSAMALPGFMLVWLAMMAAMMLPAISPVVRLYAMTAVRGRAAPVPWFVAGYLVVWVAVGAPVYVAWRALAAPLARGEGWAGELAGLVLFAAALYQLTPLKSACLRHCRSPLGFFLRQRGDLRRPATALRMGASHGLICLGCCWMLMAILVALGTMQLAVMIALSVLILVEKSAPFGQATARVAAGLMARASIALLAHPSLVTHLS